MKWPLISILLLCVAWEVSAQERIYVPDPALREVLRKQGLMTGDSIFSRSGHFRLTITQAGIHDLTGIRTFLNLSHLDVSGNELTRLNELPPGLISLFCQNNKLETLDFEHPTLKTLKAGANRIHSIKRLPQHLQTLDVIMNPLENVSNLPGQLQNLNIANCQFQTLPVLPATLQLLNYSGNPIDTNRLPDFFKSCPCVNMQRNCLPTQLVHWQLFGLENNTLFADGLEQIDTVTIKIDTQHSWGFGSENLEIIYVRQGDSLKTVKAFHQYSGRLHPKERIGEGAKTDSVWFTRALSLLALIKVLENIHHPKLDWSGQDMGYTQSEFRFDLSALPKAARDGSSRYHRCEDCSYYGLDIQIKKRNLPAASIRLDFDSGFRLPNWAAPPKEGVRIRQMLEWLALYQLSHLFFPDNVALNQSHFTEKKISELAIWAKAVFPELNK